jgi:hypothetical protein
MISTGAGWRVVGDRLEEARAKAEDRSATVVPYTPADMAYGLSHAYSEACVAYGPVHGESHSSVI